MTKKVVNRFICAEMHKLPYVSRLLPLHQWVEKGNPFSTDEEAAASKRMVIYAFSAQINLF